MYRSHVNVAHTTATGCQPNCNQQIYQIKSNHIISYHTFKINYAEYHTFNVRYSKPHMFKRIYSESHSSRYYEFHAFKVRYSKSRTFK